MARAVRRDKLRRLVQKGLVLARARVISGGYFNEDKKWYPARLKENGKFITGMMNFIPHDFKSSSGTAYQNPDGTYTLIVHSNRSFQLKVKGCTKKTKNQKKCKV